MSLDHRLDHAMPIDGSLPFERPSLGRVIGECEIVSESIPGPVRLRAEHREVMERLDFIIEELKRIESRIDDSVTLLR